jgi:hypothetical protein
MRSSRAMIALLLTLLLSQGTGALHALHLALNHGHARQSAATTGCAGHCCSADSNQSTDAPAPDSAPSHDDCALCSLLASLHAQTPDGIDTTGAMMVLPVEVRGDALPPQLWNRRAGARAPPTLI